MPAKKRDHEKALTGAELIKETCRRIRVARSLWDAHNNRACRGEREKAMALYNSLSHAEREKVPQVLRVCWRRSHATGRSQAVMIERSLEAAHRE